MVSVPSPHPIAGRDSSGVAHLRSVSPVRSGVCPRYQTVENWAGDCRYSAHLFVVRLHGVWYSWYTMRTRPINVRHSIGESERNTRFASSAQRLVHKWLSRRGQRHRYKIIAFVEAGERLEVPMRRVMKKPVRATSFREG